MDGSKIYVGKAFHAGDWIPAKVIPNVKKACVAYDGDEHEKYSFQILCHQYQRKHRWVKCNNGNVPPHAVAGGQTISGETLYIGRAEHDGSITVGKVHRSHGCLYIPFGYREWPIRDYEVLTTE